MTPEEACDAILAVFKAAWDTTEYPAVYDDIPGQKPTSATVWARATIRHATGGQRSIGGDVGSRRFSYEGTVIVQVFAPVGDGSTACYQAAALVRDAYCDARHPRIRYQDVRLNEIGQSGSFTQTNVLATFSYEDMR